VTQPNTVHRGIVISQHSVVHPTLENLRRPTAMASEAPP
jgi:hypothetical protein